MMTAKQEVIEALRNMPANVSIDEIIEELRIMAAVRRDQANIAAGRTRTQEEVEQLVESWAESWAKPKTPQS